MLADLDSPNNSQSQRFANFVEDLVGSCAQRETSPSIELSRDGDMIAKFLSEILESPDVVDTMSRYSYAHANGFKKLVLARTPDDQFHLRLHFWPKERVVEQNIHDHRFSFWSCVVRGQIANTIWVPDDAGAIYQHYRYYSRDGASEYVMTKVGESALAVSSGFERLRGSVYNFDKNWLHTITASDEPITLLLEDRRRLKSFSNVYSTAHNAQAVTLSSPSLAKSEYAELLQIAIKLLQSV